MRQIQKKCNKPKKEKTDKYTKNMVCGHRKTVHPIFFDEGLGRSLQGHIKARTSPEPDGCGC